MRIDPQNPFTQNAGTNRVTDAQTSTTNSASNTGALQPNDTVQLSSGQATVRSLVSQLDQVPDTRQSQINALRSEIQSGKFNRSNDQVAGAIVSQLFGNG